MASPRPTSLADERTGHPVPGCRYGIKLAKVLSIAALFLWLTVPVRGQLIFSNTSLSFSVLQSMVSSNAHFIVFETNGVVPFTKSLPISGLDVTMWADGTNEITFSGQNSVSNMFRVFNNATLTLSNVAIGFGSSTGTTAGTNNTTGSNGSNGGNGSSGTNGTTAVSGAAILNSGKVFLNNCTVAANAVTGGSGGIGGTGGTGDFDGGNGGTGGSGGSASGGAIYNSTNGFLQISNCYIFDNSAIAGSGGSGGAAGSGGTEPGLIGNGGSGGSALGAAIYNAGACLLYNSTFATNAVTGGSSAAAGNTFENGLSGSPGGGGLGAAVYNVGLLTVVDCTFVANLAAGGSGGNGGDESVDGFNGGNGGNGGNGEGAGIYTVTTNSAITNCTIINCTFSTNFVSAGTNGLGGNGETGIGNNGSPGTAAGGGLAVGSGKTFLANSIFAYTSGGLNGSGSVIDHGHNISSDNFTSLNTAISRNSTNPELGTLALFPGPTGYVGLTPTVPLLTNQPATNFSFMVGDPPIDQNGEPRTNGICAGAFQYAGLSILSGPPTTNVLVGTPIVFGVNATGYNPTYQWFFANSDGAPVNNATNEILFDGPAQTSWSDGYYVVVSDYTGSETSAVGTLTVESNEIGPDLISGGVDATGSNFAFSFSTLNGGTYLVQYKNALTNPAWSTLVMTNGTGIPLTIMDMIGSNATRFFRVISE